MQRKGTIPNAEDDDTPQASRMKPQLAHLNLDDIRLSQSNEMFRDETELTDSALSDLIGSIKGKGVLQPILVRPYQTPANQKKVTPYEVVAGERRYRASKAAGLKTIPAYIRELTDAEAFEMQVTENLERKDVHPLKEAHAYKYLVDKDPKLNTVAELAHRFAKTEHYITTRLKLNDLIPDARKDFADNLMSLGHALLIARLEVTDQKKLLDRCTSSYTKDKQRVKYYETIHELEDFINEDIICNLSSAAFKKDDATLLPKAGACTTCPKRSGANQLFSDLQDKDRCFDAKCFLAKRVRFMATQIETLLEKEPDLVFLSTNYKGNPTDPAIEKTLRDNKVLVLKKNVDFDTYTWDKSKPKIKGIYVNGEELGKRVTVFSTKAVAKGKLKPDQVDAKVAIANIKQRSERAIELDGEKVYGRILEALKVHSTQTSPEADQNYYHAAEDVWLRYIIYDKLGFTAKREVEKILKLKDKDPAQLFKSLESLNQDQVLFMIRRIMLDQYGGNIPKSDPAFFIRKIAAGYKDIPIDEYEAEQKQVRKTREERAAERIRQLQPKKSEKKQPGKNGLSALKKVKGSLKDLITETV